MVEQQIARRGVRDPATLQGLREVPRHLFVPKDLIKSAYDDNPLPIGHSQTISQPYIVGLMIEAAQLAPDSIVLEIGTGSGYAAAVVSRMVQKVYTIERIAPLAEGAIQRYKQLDYTNIEVKVGDGSLGLLEKAPFDAIIVTAGAPIVPESLKAQLKVGGRLIIPVGESLFQQLVRLRRHADGTFSQELLEAVHFVPLIGQEGWTE